jgi:phage-related protein
MKPLTFLGDSLKAVRGFPDDARRDAGFRLRRAQQGQQPDDFKPMPAVAMGVEELRVWCEEGIFRVIYMARLPEALFVRTPFKRRRRPHRRPRLNWPPSDTAN